jgi:hypothetical protein
VEAKGKGFIRQYAPLVLQRADEPAEAIAYFKKHHKGVVPHGLLRGIADTLPKFNEYALGKYKKTGAISMRDVFRLARPKPSNDEQKELWRKVVMDELETPYTCEGEISKCHSDIAKKDKWNELIASGKLGLFALVRNIRNIIDCGANIDEAVKRFTPENVKGSGILPFQWYKAFLAISEKHGRKYANVFADIVKWSLSDIPTLPGSTLIACDNSGSMTDVCGTRGLSNMDIANLMGAMALLVSEKYIVGTFGDTFRPVEKISVHKTVFENKSTIDQYGKTTGSSTNANRIIEFMIASGLSVDRIIVFSDMQCYSNDGWNKSFATSFEEYKNKINKNVVLYSVNLASNDNTSQFNPKQRVVELAGWSDNIFRYIQAMEVGQNVIDDIIMRNFAQSQQIPF